METSIINKIKKTINNKNILYLWLIGQKKFSYEFLCSNFGFKSRESIVGNGKIKKTQNETLHLYYSNICNIHESPYHPVMLLTVNLIQYKITRKVSLSEGLSKPSCLWPGRWKKCLNYVYRMLRHSLKAGGTNSQC